MSTPSTLLRPSRPSRVRRRGASLVEYALVLTAIAVPTILGVTVAGARLFADYRAARDHVIRSTP
ncbi:MAG: hypothetical protein IPK71_18215 [Myxococcales bacterium]|nr:hypothetical protein [Myxococcales bacterium]